MLTIAVSKGRIFDEALPLLAAVGIQSLDDPQSSRKLILSTTRKDIRLVIIRAADVPTFVEYGAAELGIVGKDVLLEHDSGGLYEPLDLGISCCRLMTAGPRDCGPVEGRIRVATKYVKSTQNYFAKKGRQVEVIKLYGSMELAPLVGLSDCIVDLVDTGNTLNANGLMPLELIENISARLVVNKAAMKMKHAAIDELLRILEQEARKVRMPEN